jgi:hypothetical protein
MLQLWKVYLMIVPLQANLPVLISHFDGVVTIYVRQYGAGNLRITNDRESALNGTSLAPGQIVDGIPQAAAQGVQQYFWSGDLWLISDVSGPVMVQAPAYTSYVQRLKGAASPADFTLPSEREGNLSTYPL